ncbi:MAG: hypothetical protein M1829_002879 [Trizodia sp. TS-e1964]|nr:MAG: hypothetical protein M1829_002879 [Trizodia sp. TS-e1964]
MPSQVRPLLLPRLVEARKINEQKLETADLEAASPSFSISTFTTSTPPSSTASPITPTFSKRGLGRYSSSSSSIDLAQQQTHFNGSPSLQPVQAFTEMLKSGKRALPDVVEEPFEKEDFDMAEDSPELYDCFCDDQMQCSQSEHQTPSPSNDATTQTFDYALSDDVFSDREYFGSPRTKKRRAGESPFAGFKSRLSFNRIPSFSRRWKVRNPANTMAFEGNRDITPSRAGSRAASSRASSLTGSFHQAPDIFEHTTLPPTPAMSVCEPLEVSDDSSSDMEMLEDDCKDGSERMMATTPLLPPLLIPDSTTQDVVRSPLQSPTVAEAGDSGLIVNSPVCGIGSPQSPGLPSPPLSTKPSISSFHRGRPGHLIPSNEIPPILIAEPNDEWANKLGHANFSIHPEPYLPEEFDAESCNQLRANWDQARFNYTKHLVRTGEHHGATSKTYSLTEEKWAGIDSLWRRNFDLALSKASQVAESAGSPRPSPVTEPMAQMKIPSLNDAKFPQLGDEDIVGPMVQVAASANLQRKRTTRSRILRFLQGVNFPSAVMTGRFNEREKSL